MISALFLAALAATPGPAGAISCSWLLDPITIAMDQLERCSDDILASGRGDPRSCDIAMNAAQDAHAQMTGAESRVNAAIAEAEANGEDMIDAHPCDLLLVSRGEYVTQGLNDALQRVSKAMDYVGPAPGR